MDVLGVQREIFVLTVNLLIPRAFASPHQHF
uniref:Uncharacterized protein n=1 Tax=Anguilla anguilla TaxID=7936 RepID=A0A0E9QN46_ANGAN